jgi:hypothetical protein
MGNKDTLFRTECHIFVSSPICIFNHAKMRDNLWLLTDIIYYRCLHCRNYANDYGLTGTLPPEISELTTLTGV